MSGTRGSSGLGSVSIEQIDSSTINRTRVSPRADESRKLYIPFVIVNAGDHCSLRMSKQMLPLALMFG